MRSRVSFEGILELLALPAGLLIILGLYTRQVSLVLAVLYFILFFLGPLQRGPFTHRNGGDPILLNAFFFLYLSAAGGGAWSVDRLRGSVAIDKRWTPIVLGILRIAAAGLFLMHGLEKIFGVGGGRIDRDIMTIRGLAGWLEIVGGSLFAARALYPSGGVRPVRGNGGGVLQDVGSARFLAQLRASGHGSVDPVLFPVSVFLGGRTWRLECRCMARAKAMTNRRDFLKSAAVTGAALVPGGGVSGPAEAGHYVADEPRQTAAAAQASAPIAPREADPPDGGEVITTDRPGGDFMVDVIKTLDFEYVASNPGSSFRGIHESIINYGDNTSPEFITCCHEESSVAMAHGYFKAEGKPMAVLCHGTVGLQHAAMAIYNAYCDRVPVYVMAGNSLDATLRRPGVEWSHSVQDAAAMVRDYIKWDDQPVSLPHFAESAVRAYKIAMTPPMMPVLLVVDGGLQEDPISPEITSRLRIPRLTRATPPQGDSGAVAEAARLLVNAQNPLIVADRAARTPAGVQRLIELAETLQAPGRRSRRTDELSLAPPTQSEQRGAPARRRGRCDSRPRADRLLGDGQCRSRRADAHVAVDCEAGHETDQHHGARSGDERKLPGLPAISRGGRGDGGRCRSHAARVDRSLQAIDHRRQTHGVRGARQDAWPRHTGARSSARAPRRRMRGTRAPSARPA